MTNVASPELRQAIGLQQQHQWPRFLMVAACGACIGIQISWSLTLVWGGLWCVLQVAVIGQSRRTRRQPLPDASIVSAGIVVAGNLIFAVMPAAAVLTGRPWIVITGLLMIMSGLVNACVAGGASLFIFAMGAIPAFATLVALTIVATRHGANPSILIAMAVNLIGLTVASLIAQRVGASALMAAKAASDSKGEFLANVSHEIRTPLNGVIGMAQVMATDELSAAQRARLELILRSGRSLVSLLNDVLDLSKIEAGMLEITPAAFDFEQLALDLVGAFEATCITKPVTVRAELDATLAGAWIGDAARTRQILSNLLSNAVKFTGEGEVLLRASAVGEGIEVSVVDSGIGIPAERLAEVFGKYVQASAGTARQYGGTGLGLTICRDLAIRMGGSLTAESTLGAGSTFRLWLPLERAIPLGDSGTDAPEEPMLFEGVRVLAAEDHPTNQAVLRLLFEPLGVNLHLVGDGLAALEAWRSDDWDVILMDVQMPVMDGLEALQAIRDEEAKTARAPSLVIALTANAMRHQVDGYLAAGFDGFVAKPIEFESMLQEIARVLRASPRPKPSPGAEPRRQ